MTAVRIRQVRSANGTKPNQRATLRALGLGRPGAEAQRADGPQLRGQLRVIEHLVNVEEEKSAPSRGRSPSARRQAGGGDA